MPSDFCEEWFPGLKVEGGTQRHTDNIIILSVYIGYRHFQCDIPCITTIQAKQTVRIDVSDRLFICLFVYFHIP